MRVKTVHGYPTSSPHNFRRHKVDSNKRQYRDRTIPTRQERRAKDSREEDTIRFAMRANSATAVVRREEQDDN